MLNRKFILCTLLLVTFSLQAQEAKRITYGVKAGLNLASFLNEEPIKEKSARLGLTGGGFINFAVNEQWAIQVEALYTMKGTRIPEQSFGGIHVPASTAVLDYVEFPALARLKFGHFGPAKFVLISGVSLAYLVRSKLVIEDAGRFGERAEIEYGDFVQETETSFIIGIGLTMSKRFSLEARYSFGLTRAFNADSEDPDFDDKNRVFSLVVAMVL